MNLLLAILTPFLGAALIAWTRRRGRVRFAVKAGVTTLIALGLLVPLLPGPFRGETLVWRLPWLPDLGLDLALRFDGLGLLFALMILGIGLLVILYARYYLSPRTTWGASTPVCCSSWGPCSAWSCRRTSCCCSCSGS